VLLAIALALPAGTARESFAVPALVRLEAATALRSHSDAPSRPRASILARGSRGEAPRGSLNLAVLTSLAAGSWLEHVTASGRPLREGDIA